MISIYVMPVRRDPTGNLIEIKKEDLRWHSKFVPSGETELSIPFGDMDQNTNEFIVMPATYFVSFVMPSYSLAWNYQKIHHFSECD